MSDQADEKIKRKDTTTRNRRSDQDDILRDDIVEATFIERN